MSDEKYSASEWAAMSGGHSVEGKKEKFQIIQDLSESQLFRTKKAAESQSVRDAADLVFANLLLLTIFNNSNEFTPLSSGYADRTVMYSNFNNHRINATDLYTGLNRLLGNNQDYTDADKEDIARINIKHLDVKRYLQHLAKANDDTGFEAQFLLKFQRDLDIQNSYLRALRRMAADWNNLSDQQKAITVTKLEQYMRTNFKRADLTMATSAFKKQGGYNVKKGGMGGLAKAAAGAAIGYGLYRLGKAHRDTSYSKAGTEITPKYPSRRKK
jgi:hypothetical protein